VTQTFGSWNRMVVWLRQLDSMRCGIVIETQRLACFGADPGRGCGGSVDGLGLAWDHQTGTWAATGDRRSRDTALQCVQARYLQIPENLTFRVSERTTLRSGGRRRSEPVIELADPENSRLSFNNLARRMTRGGDARSSCRRYAVP
jgi:hypothetical protein